MSSYTRWAATTALATMVACVPAQGEDPVGTVAQASTDVTIGNGFVSVGVSRNFAGAVNYLAFRGLQIADYRDAGRLVQMAVTFDDLAECDNPTEGGSIGQLPDRPSHSVLTHLTTAGNSLSSTALAANWLYDGNTGPSCPNGVRANVPAVSDTHLTKRIQLDYGGDPQIMHWQTTVHLARPRAQMAVEAVTGYHIGPFDHFYVVNPKSGGLEPMAPFQSRPFPMIMASSDEQYAVGVFANDFELFADGGWNPRPSRDFAPLYGSYLFPAEGTTKWGIGFNHRNVEAGNYVYDSFLVFGTVAEVHARLVRLMTEQREKSLVKLAADFDGVGFSQGYYAATRPDVVAAHTDSFEGLVTHFLYFGLDTGARGSEDLHVPSYQARYPDILHAFGDDKLAALRHWILRGRFEGREGTP